MIVALWQHHPPTYPASALKPWRAPDVKVTDADRDGLNVDVTAGKSVAWIRCMHRQRHIGLGCREHWLWADNEWRCGFGSPFPSNMVEESGKPATLSGLYLKPNDANTRDKSESNDWKLSLPVKEAERFQHWQAVQSPEHSAFYVKAWGLNATMTAQDIPQGHIECRDREWQWYARADLLCQHTLRWNSHTQNAGIMALFAGWQFQLTILNQY